MPRSKSAPFEKRFPRSLLSFLLSHRSKIMFRVLVAILTSRSCRPSKRHPSQARCTCHNSCGRCRYPCRGHSIAAGSGCLRPFLRVRRQLADVFAAAHGCDFCVSNAFSFARTSKKGGQPAPLGEDADTATLLRNAGRSCEQVFHCTHQHVHAHGLAYMTARLCSRPSRLITAIAHVRDAALLQSRAKLGTVTVAQRMVHDGPDKPSCSIRMSA